MAPIESQQHHHSLRSDPWSIWISFGMLFLIFISLWIVDEPLWHLTVSGMTLVILWFFSSNLIKTLAFVVGLVVFLAILQISFSPYMRNLFIRSLEKGFVWKDWQFLLFAVERLSWPLVIVSAFQSKLNSPRIVSYLILLISPFRWLGLKVEKLQMLFVLALRFIPSLKREWQRFSYFQTYFLTDLPQKTIRQKMKMGQGILKAMISHVIHRAVYTGDLLALRGLPIHPFVKLNHALIPILFWLAGGMVFFYVDIRLSYFWLAMSCWLMMVPVAIKRNSSS